MSSERFLLDQLSVDASLQTVSLNNYEVNFLKAGEGPPILLIHGANFGWGQWIKNIPSLAKNGTVYAVDLPGSGKSTSVDFSSSSFESMYVNTLVAFVETVIREKTLIIGHSIGAWVGMRILAERPELVAGVIISNPLGFLSKVPLHQRLLTSKRLVKLLTRTVMRPTKKNMDSFLKSELHNKDALSEELLSYYHENVNSSETGHPFFLIHSLMQGGQIRTELILEEIEDTNVPVLGLFGEFDKLVTVEHLDFVQEQTPFVETRLIERVGHVIPLEKDKLFNSIVLDFMKRL